MEETVCYIKILTQSIPFYKRKSLASRALKRSVSFVRGYSKEYSDAVVAHLGRETRLVTCIFGELREDRVIEKGTLCKMARGEMVRFMAENHVGRPQDMQAFDRLGYRYDPARSNEGTYVFIWQSNKSGE